jgi:L-lactate dehydrogenase complex protein LldG
MENTNSKQTILSKVRQNKPNEAALPDVDFLHNNVSGSIRQFSAMLDSIGGKLFLVSDWIEVISAIQTQHPGNKAIYSPIPEVQDLTGQAKQEQIDGHDLANVEVGIVKAHFAVAENGAVWLTDDQLGNRALPFICQHLAVVVDEHNVLPTMHDAYARNAGHQYSYGAFIAGASKTADIEQSLVLGAHGPRSMMVFIKRSGQEQTIVNSI